MALGVELDKRSSRSIEAAAMNLISVHFMRCNNVKFWREVKLIQTEDHKNKYDETNQSGKFGLLVPTIMHYGGRLPAWSVMIIAL